MLSKTVRAAGAALLAALVTGAIAIAAADNDNSGGPSGNAGGPGAQAPGESDRGPNGSGGGPGSSSRGQGGPGKPGGPPFLRNMTFAEIHTQKDGQEVVIRVDRGKVKSRTAESITITANNGSEVTIPVDGETRVRGPRAGKQNASLDSLREGALVTVDRESDKAAHVVAVMPKHRQGQGPQGQRQQPQGQGQPQGPQQGQGQQSDGPPSGGPR